jgi:hypothetical protein
VKQRFLLVLLIALLMVALLGIHATVLAGSANTGGSYLNGAMIKYNTKRYVVDPSLPGPESCFT